MSSRTNLTVVHMSTCDLISHFRSRGIPEDDIRAFRSTGGYGYPQSKKGRFTALYRQAGELSKLLLLRSSPGCATVPPGSCGATCGIRDEPCMVRWWEFVVKDW